MTTAKLPEPYRLQNRCPILQKIHPDMDPEEARAQAAIARASERSRTLTGIPIEKMDHNTALASLRHCERLSARHSNKDIDASRSNLNTYIHIDGQDPLTRFRRRVASVKAHKPKGRRYGSATKELVSAVVSVPEDFPYKGNIEMENRFLIDAAGILAGMCGGKKNLCGIQVHRDEQHLYYISTAILTAESHPPKPGDPPVQRMSRVHAHIELTTILTPQELTAILGKPPRSRRRKGPAPEGEWFCAAALITRPWLKEANRRIQELARTRYHSHFEAPHGYSTSAEVEQLKLESAVAEQAEPLAAKAREQAEAADTDRREAAATLEKVRRRDAGSMARKQVLDAREASFAQRVASWERDLKARFIDRLRTWLESELAKAREVFARAREEGYETGRAEGYKAGVEQGVRARETAPEAPVARSVSDVQLRAVEELRRGFGEDYASPLDGGRPKVSYTAAEWAALPPARRAALTVQGVAPPQAYREAGHGRAL
ncbi:plasmid recombination protein [Bifidobacterium sp. ESL0775]|uniref:plasmid recombination protein n=1 Tax=Bifidobacterium sp. ESL0775 TaxID=2983230 RepID=UPI0023F75891|nr:plasmid recombination protein [Bifidobacterium sp. ESL0775]WEV69472.1 plasmid recombination protein [Bifidobacterium sp. ESL0775]